MLAKGVCFCVSFFLCYFLSLDARFLGIFTFVLILVISNDSRDIKFQSDPVFQIEGINYRNVNANYHDGIEISLLKHLE